MITALLDAYDKGIKDKSLENWSDTIREIAKIVGGLSAANIKTCLNDKALFRWTKGRVDAYVQTYGLRASRLWPSMARS